MSTTIRRFALVTMLAFGALATTACSGWNACDPFHPQGPSATDLRNCGGCDCGDCWDDLDWLPCDCR